MSGRYFSAPLLASTVLVARHNFEAVVGGEATMRAPALRMYFLLLALGLITGLAPVFLVAERAPNFGKGAEGGHRIFVDAHDVSDERRVYDGMRLLRRLEVGPLVSEFARGKWLYDARAQVKVKLVGPLGFTGYILGPYAHVIDLNSLADPLMPRMPLYQIGEWRIGHFRHFIPPGYLETLRSGENRIEDRNIALYYDKLSFVVRGELWNVQRMIEIWKFNTGKYDPLLENIAVTP